MKIWVLTFTVNEYNQHGEYFMSVYKDKPSESQLRSEGLSSKEVINILKYGETTDDYTMHEYQLTEEELK